MPKKFPKHYLFCPRCGGRLTINAKKKFDLCGSCGFEMYDAVLAGVTVIIVNEKNEVLLGKRKNDPCRGKWGTLGGFLERGETTEDAARREIQEEIGVHLSKIGYLGSYPVTYRYQNVDYAYLETTFLARVKKINYKARDDISMAKFFKPKSIPYAQLAWPSQRTALRKFLKK